MITINLTRQTTDGNAVFGSMDIPVGKDMVRVATLENADFLIPAGRYPLKNTWSPRFQKDMPLICDVPDRDGIRIHMGTKPEHSTGCVLTSAFGLQTVKSFINQINKIYENEEEIFIVFRDPQ